MPVFQAALLAVAVTVSVMRKVRDAFNIWGDPKMLRPPRQATFTSQGSRPPRECILGQYPKLSLLISTGL